MVDRPSPPTPTSREVYKNTLNISLKAQEKWLPLFDKLVCFTIWHVWFLQLLTDNLVFLAIFVTQLLAQSPRKGMEPLEKYDS